MSDQPKKPLNFAEALRIKHGAARSGQSQPAVPASPAEESLTGTLAAPVVQLPSISPPPPPVPTPSETEIGANQSQSQPSEISNKTGKRGRPKKSLPESTSLVDLNNPNNKNDFLGYFFTSLVDLNNPAEKNKKSQFNDPNINLLASLPTTDGYLKLHRQIVDFLYPQLDPAEQAIHLQLYRLSWGYNKTTCIIGLPKLAQRSGMSTSAAQQAVNRLMTKGLIKKVRMILGKGIEQGVEYEVPLPDSLFNSTSLPESTSLVDLNSIIENKYIIENFDARAPMRDTRAKAASRNKKIQTHFQTLTGKPWLPTDEQALDLIEHLGEDAIVEMMTRIRQRSPEPIGSFAYFAKAIIRELQFPEPLTTLALKHRIAAIVAELRELRIGESYPPSELVHDLKNRCLQEDLPWNDDLVNAVLANENKSKPK